MRMQRDEQSDASLVQAVLAGDQAAYTELVGRYERSVQAAAMRVLADGDAARDAAQETFVAAYRQLGQLRNPAAFGAWILKTAQRHALRAARAARRRHQLHRSHDSLDAAPSGRPPDSHHHELLEALDRLPIHERLAVTLHYLDGHSMAEIAAMLRRPVGTVTKQLSRARVRLRRWLNTDE